MNLQHPELSLRHLLPPPMRQNPSPTPLLLYIRCPRHLRGSVPPVGSPPATSPLLRAHTRPTLWSQPRARPRQLRAPRPSAPLPRTYQRDWRGGATGERGSHHRITHNPWNQVCMEKTVGSFELKELHQQAERSDSRKYEDSRHGSDREIKYGRGKQAERWRPLLLKCGPAL